MAAPGRMANQSLGLKKEKKMLFGKKKKSKRDDRAKELVRSE
jgi:hypothetical protein